MKGRFSRIVEQNIKGISLTSESEVEINKVRWSTIDFISSLTKDDIILESTKDYRFQYLMHISKLEKDVLSRYIKYTKYLHKLSPEARLKNQIRLTQNWFDDSGNSASLLKKNLRYLGYYTDNDNAENVNESLINAIMRFQSSENIIPVDGIYREVTHNYLKKLLNAQ